MSTVYFLGVGMTNSFGIPTTKQQADVIRKYLNSNINNDQYKNECEILNNIIKHYFKNELNINALYNLLDFFIIGDTYLLMIDSDKNEKVYTPAELKNARSFAIKIIFNYFIEQIKRNGEGGNYRKYVDFYKKLALNDINKKIKSFNRTNAKTDYSIVNLNWDLYSIFPIIKANQEINEKNAYWFNDKRNVKLRIYTDFSCSRAYYQNKSEWFPFTESAVKAINNPNFDSSRRCIFLKAYFPHGLMNLYKCPVCGKHIMDINEVNINAMFNISYLKNEDVANCPFCNNKIKRFDFDILVQTNYKVKNPYFEGIKIDMLNEFRNADKIVFIGYSLPDDDKDYETMLRIASKSTAYVVLYQKNMPKKFTSYDETVELLRQSGQDADDIDSNIRIAKRYKNVFGKDNVKFCFCGAPDCFEINDIF